MFIDFFIILYMKCIIINIFYDTNSSARLSLILYYNSLSAFVLLQKNVHVNSIVYSGSYNLFNEDIKEGYSMLLKYMPLFSNLSNIELIPFIGSTLCRAAEVSCIMICKNNNKAILKSNCNWEVKV